MNDERERTVAGDMRSRVIADCAALLPLARSACKAMDEGVETEVLRLFCGESQKKTLRQVPSALLRPLRSLVRFHSTEDRERTTEIPNGKLEVLNRTIRHEHERTRREIVKSINARNTDGLDICGPRTPECRDQVMAVVAWLANPKHPQNVHHACDRTYHVTENGYDNKEKLYLWCHRNESRIWALVETYRLNHDID